MLLVPGWFSNLDIQWESPYLARFLHRLSEKARLIITDRRGWGLSERFSPSDVPPLEALADDLAVVLDAAGSERAVVATADDTGVIAQFFAAAHPERVAGLVLIDSYVSYRDTQETPWMPDEAWWEEFCQEIRASWGRSWEGGPDVGGASEREWFLRMQRGCSRAGRERRRDTALPRHHHGGCAARYPRPDPRPRRQRQPWWLIRDGDRTLSRRPYPLRSAGRVFGGEDFFWYKAADTILREIDGFLETLHAEQAVFDRVLATVLFTDIVGSTEHAARIGDAAWKALLARHHEVVRALISRYRGPRSIRRAMGSSPRSTGRHGRSTARGRSSMRCASSGWRSGLGFTPASASRWTEKSRGSPYTSALASGHWRGPPRSLCLPP